MTEVKLKKSYLNVNISQSSGQVKLQMINAAMRIERQKHLRAGTYMSGHQNDRDMLTDTSFSIGQQNAGRGRLP